MSVPALRNCTPGARNRDGGQTMAADSGPLELAGPVHLSWKSLSAGRYDTELDARADGGRRAAGGPSTGATGQVSRPGDPHSGQRGLTSTEPRRSYPQDEHFSAWPARDELKAYREQTPTTNSGE